MSDEQPIELRTHTSLWRSEKKLYKLYDFTLPMPISVKQLGLLFGVGVPWVILMKVIGVPFAPPFGHIFWIGPPAIVTWWANKPVAEGKRLFEFVSSQIRYFTQAKHLARLRPFTPDKVHVVRSKVWHASPDRTLREDRTSVSSYAETAV